MSPEKLRLALRLNESLVEALQRAEEFDFLCIVGVTAENSERFRVFTKADGFCTNLETARNISLLVENQFAEILIQIDAGMKSV